ncbi:MAG: hypothetical protein HY912_05280 [Desulfomonile tiedjei]|uniref:HEAT repeat domain-containing protein n=1 Tax=Desulfomonile tiedjei TaxID=2358 RepID=A0A9D6V499_9BACT|nr:hypothetical protein [Desulfomonile tiedjei]
MKRMFAIAVILILAAMGGISAASDASVDNHIRDLKSDNPEVRAKAAHELGCG